jgi:glyoxylate utilization-related uncharacterized protein
MSRWSRPRGRPAGRNADCLDPAAEQALHVLDGVLYVVHGDDEAVLTAGDHLTIRPGDPRRIWNAGDETARVVVTGRTCEPALSAAA